MRTKIWTEWFPSADGELVPRTHWVAEGDGRLIAVLKYGWFTPFPEAAPFSPGENRIEWTTLTVPTAGEYARFREKLTEIEMEIRKILSVIRATTQ